MYKNYEKYFQRPHFLLELVRWPTSQVPLRWVQWANQAHIAGNYGQIVAHRAYFSARLPINRGYLCPDQWPSHVHQAHRSITREPRALVRTWLPKICHQQGHSTRTCPCLVGQRHQTGHEGAHVCEKGRITGENRLKLGENRLKQVGYRPKTSKTLYIRAQPGLFLLGLRNYYQLRHKAT